MRLLLTQEGLGWRAELWMGLGSLDRSGEPQMTAEFGSTGFVTGPHWRRLSECDEHTSWTSDNEEACLAAGCSWEASSVVPRKHERVLSRCFRAWFFTQTCALVSGGRSSDLGGGW